MQSQNTAGNYHFLGAEGRPFSNGAAADPGFDLVHATFERPLPLDRGLEAAARHLDKASRPVQSITGFELRIPEPFDSRRFEEFNHGYGERVTALGLLADGLLRPAHTTRCAAATAGSD